MRLRSAVLLSVALIRDLQRDSVGLAQWIKNFI